MHVHNVWYALDNVLCFAVLRLHVLCYVGAHQLQ